MTKMELTAALRTLRSATAAKLVEVEAEFAGREVANLEELAWGRVVAGPLGDLARSVLDVASRRQIRSLTVRS